jgi:hypothetical protein
MSNLCFALCEHNNNDATNNRTKDLPQLLPKTLLRIGGHMEDDSVTNCTKKSDENKKTKNKKKKYQ